MEYVKVRDQIRHVVHREAAMKRLDFLWNAIVHQEQITLRHLKNNSSTVSSAMDENVDLQSRDVTRQWYITKIRAKLRNFVFKYKPLSGTHSFVAGLRTLIERQLDLHDDSLIVWTFRAVTLSECGFRNDDGSKQTITEYIQDSIDLLFAMLVHIQPYTENGKDLEVGGP